MTKKVIFISYSHDNEEHKKWVKKFADDLELLGSFEVLLDQNMPKGFSLTRFMEQGLVNADKVLVIGTPQYKQKSETGKGVAFEESIISTELMQDIDNCKYYPILRAGTFETSFPVVLQGRGGDDLSDDTKYTDKLSEVVESIANEKPIPVALAKKQINGVPNNQPVAIVYLSQDLIFKTYYGRPSDNIDGIAISVSITNTSKEVRYFNQPLFKLSVPIEGRANAFYMMNTITPVLFPVKLEYGQQVSVTYKLVPGNMKMFANTLSRDPDASIKAVVSTSLGEKSESQSYKVAELLKNTKYVKDDTDVFDQLEN